MTKMDNEIELLSDQLLLDVLELKHEQLDDDFDCFALKIISYSVWFDRTVQRDLLKALYLEAYDVALEYGM